MPSRGRRTDEPMLLAWWGLSVAFGLSAVAVTVVQVIAPFARGWWLVAYLVLVGAMSQLLLGAGQFALGARMRTRPGPRRLLWSQLTLWNVGTVTVAVADLAEAPAGVIAGSLALLAALGLFVIALRALQRRARERVRRLERSYVVLVALLAASTVVGTVLADAVPGG